MYLPCFVLVTFGCTYRLWVFIEKLPFRYLVIEQPRRRAQRLATEKFFNVI